MAHAIDLLRKQERGAVAEQQREWLPCRARRTRKRPRLDQLERHFVVVEHGRERVVHMAGEVFQRQQFHASPPSGASPAWYRRNPGSPLPFRQDGLHWAASPRETATRQLEEAVFTPAAGSRRPAPATCCRRRRRDRQSTRLN